MSEFLDVKATIPQDLSWTLMPPVVYRYMDQQWVDKFFETGELMLTSFARCSQHRDEQRADEFEGMALVVGRGPGDLRFESQVRMGADFYLLCTSVRGDKSLMQEFECDGFFRINDTFGFALAIAKKLGGFLRGFEGMCNYTDRLVIEKPIPAGLTALFDGSTPAVLERQAAAVMQIAGVDALLAKRTAYANQLEYRLLWNVDHDVTDSIVVRCPEAVQFCEKITGGDLPSQNELAHPGMSSWPGIWIPQRPKL